MPNRALVADQNERTFENPLASLVANGKITQQQYLAGQKYAEIYHKYLESIGAPHPFARALDPAGSNITGPQQMPSDRECLKRKQAFFEAHDRLEAAGVRARMSTTNIAVYEQAPVDEWDLESLRIGLSALL